MLGPGAGDSRRGASFGAAAKTSFFRLMNRVESGGQAPQALVQTEVHTTEVSGHPPMTTSWKWMPDLAETFDSRINMFSRLVRVGIMVRSIFVQSCVGPIGLCSGTPTRFWRLRNACLAKASWP